jgi:hypothetical protein
MRNSFWFYYSAVVTGIAFGFFVIMLHLMHVEKSMARMTPNEPSSPAAGGSGAGAQGGRP